jgi:hypothetical protein
MSSSTDIQIVRGDDEAIELEFTNEVDNTPVNLTDCAIMFTVRASKGDTNDDNALIKKDVYSHTDPTAGKTTINLLKTDTAVTTGDYFYDVQYVDTENKVKTLVIGKLSIVQDVTKRS